MQLAYFSFSSLCKEIINKNIDKAGVFQNIYRLAWLKRWWSNRWSKHHHWTISTKIAFRYYVSIVYPLNICQNCSTASSTSKRKILVMRSKTNFRVSFFLKKAKLLKNGEASVAMRITVDGQRVENNIRKSILPNLWGSRYPAIRWWIAIWKK